MKRSEVVNARASASRSTPSRWVYGINAVRRRLELRPDTVLEVCLANRRSSRLDGVIQLLPHHVPIRDVDEAALSRIAGTTAHQGIAARTTSFQYRDLESLLGQRSDLLLMIDQMQDPQNFGALLRTAAAAGVAGVIIPRDGAVGVTPAAEKAAAGAVHDIAVCQVVNLRRTLDALAAQGFWTVGLIPHGGESLFDVDLPERLVVVLGGEGGIRPLVARSCDFRVSIPMTAGIESLNASVAGAIVLFELRRRRSLDR